MEKFSSFEAHVANLLRVYDARNEIDLVKVMTAISDLVEHVHALEARVSELEIETGQIPTLESDIRDVERDVARLDRRVD